MASFLTRAFKSITQSFNAVYQELYLRCLNNVPIEIVNWKVMVSGPRPTIQLQKLKSSYQKESATKRKRPAYFPEVQVFVDCPVYDRYRMGPGTTLYGPAIVEERESTLVVGPGGRLEIDDYLNAIVEFSQ